MSEMLTHMFSLASNPRASVFHVDAVYARKCVMFMLRSLIGGLLGERAQIAAAKEICLVIVKQMNMLGTGVILMLVCLLRLPVIQVPIYLRNRENIKVLEFDSCQGNVKKLMKSQRNLWVKTCRENCLLLTSHLGLC